MFLWDFKVRVVYATGKTFLTLNSISETEDTCALLLDWAGENQPFGHFWFYVESAQFSPLLGIRWKLRVVR